MPSPRRGTRVAVAQLAIHPAAILDRRAPLEDPIFSLKTDDSLAFDDAVVAKLGDRLPALRARVRAAYCAQWRIKVDAILQRCHAWKVRLLVLPEYAAPWQELEWLAQAAGDIVVVAGTHTAERAAKQAGVYERLGMKDLRYGEAISPVLHQGRVIGLQPKLYPATPELRSLRQGDRWAPVTLPDEFGGAMGVLICLDFLISTGLQHTEHEQADTPKLDVGSLDRCRFLAVPSLTPGHSVGEFQNDAWKSAERYRRPVLYANTADGGGTSIFVDEDRLHDLERFPERVGVLDADDEGLIVADVDLGYVRAHGKATPFEQARPVIPVAAASLLYTGHPIGAEYARWLDAQAELLARDDDDAFDALVDRVGEARELLLGAVALPGGKMRARRLRELLRAPDRAHQVEGLRAFLREVPLPTEALPLPTLRAAMAKGATECLFEWKRDVRGLDAAYDRLVQAAKRAEELRDIEWSEAGRAAVQRVAGAVRGEPEVVAAPVVETRIVEVVRAPEGLDPRAIPDLRGKGIVLSFLETAAPDFVDSRIEFDGASRPPEVAMARSKYPAWTRDELARSRAPWEAELAAHFDLELLMRANGIAALVVVNILIGTELPDAATALLTGANGSWSLHCMYTVTHRRGYVEAAALLLDAQGYGPVSIVSWSSEELSRQVAALHPRVLGAKPMVQNDLELRLAEVRGRFVEPDVRLAGELIPALTALDRWLSSERSMALVLGEFGTGKSTLLAKWCSLRWEALGGPRPILCNLAGAGAEADPWALLLDGAGLPNDAANRAALRLLMRRGELVACFDGFDEMATRVDGSTLGQRLAALVAVGDGGGRVVISSRVHYFPSEAAADATLRASLGDPGRWLRLDVQLLSKKQVEQLVREVRPDDAEAALQKIATTYDLRDLVERPILLAMVLQTLDRFSAGSRVARADVYEAYLARWLENTHNELPHCLDDEQKIAFAESLAEQLWRSGSTSCTWDVLRDSVRERLMPRLPDDVPTSHAMTEVCGSAFFVWEAGERYRFAHKSFLEYFFARSLAQTLAKRPAEALDTKPLSREVADFVGEVLRLDGDPRSSAAIRQLHRWIVDGRADEDTRPKTAEAAANALRLLLGLARWSGSVEGWFLPRMDLRGISLLREDLSGAALEGVRLDDAQLITCRVDGGSMRGASMSRACLDGSTLLSLDLSEASIQNASLDGVGTRGVSLRNANLSGASLVRSVWIDANWDGAICHSADVTACIAPHAPWALKPTLDLENIFPTTLAPHRGSVDSVNFSPNGRMFVSAGDDGIIRLWRLSDRACIASLAGHRGAVDSVMFSPDGTMLVSAGRDSVVRLWHVADGRCLAAMKGHRGRVRAVMFSPDSTMLATGGDHGEVLIWSVVDQKCTARIAGHRGRVMAVAFSPAMTELATAGGDRVVRLWRVHDWKFIGSLEGHLKPIRSVDFSPNGSMLVSAGEDRTVRVWKVAEGTCVRVLRGHQISVPSVRFFPSGSSCVSAGSDGTVRLWRTDADSPFATFKGVQGSVLSVDVSPDGETILTSGGNGTIQLWNVSEERCVASFEGETRVVSSVIFSPVGTTLASAGSAQGLRLWDLAKGQYADILEREDRWFKSISFSPDGSTIASSGSDGIVRLWDVATRSAIGCIDGELGVRSIHALSFSPDGRRLAGACDDGIVRVWSVAERRCFATLKGHKGWVPAVRFSPDGSMIASGGSDKQVRLWRSSDGTCVAVLKGHGNWVRSVSFAPDGAILASAGDDKVIRLWRVADGTCVKLLQGDSDRIFSVEFSPDGATLASAGVDGVVRLWRPADEFSVAVIAADCGWIFSMSFSSDGKMLAFAGESDIIEVWKGETHAALISFKDGALVQTQFGCNIDSYALNMTLAWRHPTSPETTFYLPLEPLRQLFHQPEQVVRYFSGDKKLRDLSKVAEQQGYSVGRTWGGVIHVLPPTTTLPAFAPGSALDLDELIGRERDLGAILSLLDGGTPVALLGPRRVGKTSLLHTLARQLAPSCDVRSASLEGQRGLASRDDIARLLAPELAGTPAPADAFLAHFQKPKRTIFLLDEMAHLRGLPPRDLGWIRAVSQRCGPLVLAGSRQDWTLVVRHAAKEPGSSFGNDLTPHELGPLPADDALAWLTRPRRDGVRIPDAVGRLVIERCGPWPFYLQVIGHALAQSIRAGERGPLQSSEALGDLYRQCLLIDRLPVFEGRWNELPRRVKQTLLEHAEGERPAFRGLPDEVQTELLDCGLCNIFGRWLPDAPFFEWVLVYRSMLRHVLEREGQAS